MSMIKFIAELSWCHMGDMELAEAMISAAADSGADYAKFQTWKVDNLKPGPWDVDGRREIYEKAELSKDDHWLLKEKCEENNIKFLTSCFNIEDLDFIRELSNEVKIPGVESRNEELVKAAIEKFDHVYLSLGTTSLSELSALFYPAEKVTVMHCVSVYPCPADKCNLSRIRSLYQQCAFAQAVGYSGHYQGIWDAIAAMMTGANVIEKHFTIDNELPGRDNKFALLPCEFKEMTNFAKEAEKMFYVNQTEDYMPEEQEARDVYTGRWSG